MNDLARAWRFILLTTVIEDPQYLTSTLLLNTLFWLLTDRVKWSPTACSTQ
jgi:hypothetical protein